MPGIFGAIKIEFKQQANKQTHGMAFPNFNARLFKRWVESMGLLETSEKGKYEIHLFVCLFFTSIVKR